MNARRLQDKVAVVTGAAQGIGEGIARRFAEEGAAVAVVDINLDAARRAADAIAADGRKAIGIECDVADRDQVNRAAEQVAQELGPIDILVSNAGVTRPAMLWKMSDEDWQTVLSTHLDGSFYWLQAVVPSMRERRNGRIIFTSSAAGIDGTIGQINYAAAKAALLGMTRSAAKELANANITVNAVAPAAATPMTEVVRTDERFRDNYLASIPLGRWAEPAEIAGAYLFIASDDAGYMTGQCISVDGGRVVMR